MSRVTPATGPPGSANLGDCQVEDVDRTDILGSAAATAAAAAAAAPQRLPVRFASSPPASPSPPSPIGRRPSLLDNRALRGVPVKALRAMYAGRLRDRNYVSLFI